MRSARIPSPAQRLRLALSQAYNTPPEWKQGAEGYTQAIRIGLWHRGDKYDDALCTGGSLQGRHVVLPL
jgi:hypothetical protein